MSDSIKQMYLKQSQSTDLGFLITSLNLANQCDLIYKNSKNQRLQVEMALIKMAHIKNVLNLAQIAPGSALAEDKKKTPSVDEIAGRQKEVPAAAPIPIEEEVAVAVPMPIEDEVPVPLPSPFPAPQVTKPAENSIKPIDPPPVNESRAPLGSAHSIKLTNGAAPKKTAGLIPSLTELEKVATGPISADPQYIDGADKEPFTTEEFEARWEAYATAAKDKGRINIYTLLTTDKPTLKETAVEVPVDSKYQEDMLREEMIELLNYLRVHLKNFDISVTPVLTVREQTKKYYTSAEKYKYLVEKNPKLEEMRKKFNLNILP